MDARMQAWIDQEDAHLTRMVRQYGWAIQYVGGERCSAPGCCPSQNEGPPFAYTIGLFGLDHPELLVFGVSEALAGALLNELGERIRAGESLLPGRMIEVEAWDRRIIPELVPNPGTIALGANRYYQRPPEVSVPVLQLSYDDEAGRFPWEPEYSQPELQPRPGTFTA